MDFAVTPGKNTEVRIAAYVTAVRCAEYDDLERIVANISVEENTQGELSLPVRMDGWSAVGNIIWVGEFTHHSFLFSIIGFFTGHLSAFSIQKGCRYSATGGLISHCFNFSSWVYP